MISHKLLQFFTFFSYAFSRFRHDKMQPRAASLTFTSLLAIVPLLAISFAIFSAFPAFDQLKLQAQSYVFENFVPGVGFTVQQYLDDFTAKAQGGLSVIGIGFLGLTSVMLLLTISGTFNQIWRVQRPAALGKRLLTYWAILTLGPIFMGINISVSSALFTAAQTQGFEDSALYFAKAIPFLVVTLGATFMFMVITNAPVLFKDALRGGVFAGLLLEGLKKGFTFYITSFPTYETIYGALATVPIFLLWIYLSWNVILLSAEVAASLPEWRAGIKKPIISPPSNLQQLIYGLTILHFLYYKSKTGKGATESQIQKRAEGYAVRLSDLLEQLQKLSLIVKTADGHWYLCQNLENYTIAHLIEQLDLSFHGSTPKFYGENSWQRKLTTDLKRITSQNERELDIPLSELFKYDDAQTGAVKDFPLGGLGEQNSTDDPKLLARLVALLGISIYNN